MGFLMVDWFDRQGRPIDMFQAAELLIADDNYKRVVEDLFVFEGEPVRVSTVWLGLNHNWSGGPPLIFETMVFGGAHDSETWRYATEEQAKEGHVEVIEFLRVAYGSAPKAD